MKLIPYLSFKRNCEEALNFYAKCLGGKILSLSKYGDSPMKDEMNKDLILHGAIEFDGNIIMASDYTSDKEPDTAGNIQLSISLNDEKKADEIFSSLSEGGSITMQLQKAFWGAKFGMFTDKFGIRWMINCEM